MNFWWPGGLYGHGMTTFIHDEIELGTTVLTFELE